MKKQCYKFRILYFLVYLADALFSPFLALYLVSLGYSSVQESIILAIVPIGSLVGNFIYAKLSGSIKKNLVLLKIMAIFQLIMVALLGYTSNFYLVLTLVLVFSLNNNPFFTLEDGVSINYVENEKTYFYSIRVFGTIAYIVGLLCNSYILSYFDNYQTPFLISAGIFLLVFLFTFMIQPLDPSLENFYRNNLDSKNDTKKKTSSFIPLFKNKNYIFYLIFYVLLVGGANIAGTYISIYFKSLGLSDSNYSLVLCMQICLELVGFLISRMLIKYLKNYKTNLIIAGSLYIISFSSLFIFTDLWVMVFVFCILRGLGSGLFFSSHVPFVSEILPKKDITKGLGLLGVFNNLFLTIGTLTAFYIYEAITFRWFYLVFTCIEILGFIFIFIIKKNENSNNTTK